MVLSSSVFPIKPVLVGMMWFDVLKVGGVPLNSLVKKFIKDITLGTAHSIGSSLSHTTTLKPVPSRSTMMFSLYHLPSVSF